MKPFMKKDNEVFGNTQAAGAGGNVTETGYLNQPAAGSPNVKGDPGRLPEEINAATERSGVGINEPGVVSPPNEAEDIDDMNDFEDADSDNDDFF